MKLNDPDFQALLQQIREDCKQVRNRVVEHREELDAKQLHITAMVIKRFFGPDFLGGKELLAKYQEDIEKEE